MSDQVLDPQLVFLTEQKPAALSEIAATGLFAVSPEADDGKTAGVLVQYDGDVEALEAAGIEVATVAGDIVTGSIRVNKLGALAAVDGVAVVEGSRPMLPELDLALADSRANVVHTGPPGHRGAGVIVGIVDTGLDWRHENFIRGDGTSRVLAIWDQTLAPQSGEASPAGFGYGVEYSQAAINGALTGTATVRHQDTDTTFGHGTHVAGIAAGDGSAAGQGRPSGTFVGVAPEADIIAVAVRGGGGRGLGDSASALDAVAYLFQRAAGLNRPMVVNMSLGDNVGPHDGTSLLERGLDNLLGGQGRAFVKSAGNAGGGGVHAGGTVTPGGAQTVSFVVATGDTTAETIDIWYEGSDRFAFRITEPGGPASATVNPGTSTTLTLGNGNRVFVDSRTNDPNNGDNRIFLTIERGSAATLEAGTWSFTLTGTLVTNGRFDAWIQRGQQVAAFVAPHESRRLTISTPGTARRVITVANAITRGGGVGGISGTSSQGPTRDGRAAPDLSAPGTIIISARAAFGSGDPYRGLAGTSMAAPHVAGAIALMLQRNRTLTQEQIRDCLRSTARADAFTGTTPNDQWGAGKLDAAAAFACVFGPEPLRTLVGPGCGVVETVLPGCKVTTRRPAQCLKTVDPICVRVTRIGCPRQTITPDCLVTVGPDCGLITRTPDCRISMRAACPPDTRAGCRFDPLDPRVIRDPAAGREPGGRLIIGRENPDTGAVTWYGFDPYGELEAIAEGGELWSEGEGEDEEEPS